ncbi:MAG: HAD hydrolase-like protein [Cyanobacteriota bacterium]|nr:HAD hydrolase-like protein [Cyanobacteriota bacterium]
MTKILFCDLDGTLRTTLSGETFAKHPRDYKIIPGTHDLLGKAITNGWQIHGISNQGGVAAGKKSLENCVNEMFYAMDLFPHLTSILFCPDFEGAKCLEVSRMNLYHIKNLQNVSREYPELIGSYRKPKPGMLEIILRRHGMKQPLNFDECCMLGDRLEDEKAARAIGVSFVWAKDWNSRN